MPVLLQSSINQHDISINQDTIYVYLDNEQKIEQEIEIDKVFVE